MIKGYKTRNIIDCNIKPINPVQCGFHKCPPSHSYGPDFRRYYVLHFVTSGKGIFTNRSGSYNVTAGQMFVIRPGESTSYEADAVEPWSYYWIGFTSDYELPTALAVNDVISAPYLESLFHAAFDAEGFDRDDSSGAYECYLCGIIWQIFGLFKRNVTEKQHKVDYLKIAVGLMRSDGRFTIYKIAELLHISKMHLTRLFNEKYGTSPGKFYFELRMSQAAELLAAGRAISDVAMTTGFRDTFEFSRAFKRHYKCPPTEYVKSLKLSQNNAH